MSAQQARILNYWRKKYLLQVLTVFLLALFVVWAAILYFDYLGFKLLIFVLSFIVAYLMFKAIKEDLQVRGEGIVLMHSGALFNDVKFDFGRGLSEKELDAQNVVKSYKFHECHSVMKSNDYVLEEDWFYSLMSAKFFSFSHTAFQGIVLALNIPLAPENLRGKIEISKTKTYISADVNNFLKTHNAQQYVLALLKLFKASSAEVVFHKGKLYFWINSETRIFYQFKLFSTNTVHAFVKRVQDIQKEVSDLLSALQS